MLSVEINKRFDDAFDLDVAFTAAAGVTILFGASGSGKTLTLKCIAGLLTPDAGRVAVDGQTLFDATRRLNLPVRQRRVGYLFQNLALFPHLTCRENVEFGMGGLTRQERRRRAAEMLAAFRIAHTADRRPRQVSGGEAQRVALARALGCRPRLLLLDEPLSAIDEPTRRGIIDDLKALNRGLRLPILYVTHSREEAVALGERALIYERGRIVADGEPLEVFAAPTALSVARLAGVENIFEGVVESRDAAGGITRVLVHDGDRQCPLDIPLGGEPPGARLRVAVPAGDILLATAEPRQTSARNVLRGQILALEDKGNRTVVRVLAGVTWAVSVTRQAVGELGLQAGQEVWLAIKTHACHRLDA